MWRSPLLLVGKVCKGARNDGDNWGEPPGDGAHRIVDHIVQLVGVDQAVRGDQRVDHQENVPQGHTHVQAQMVPHCPCAVFVCAEELIKNNW